MDVVTASGNSLIVVGISSLIIAVTTYKYKNTDRDILLWFGLASLLSIVATRAFFLPAIPNIIIENDSFVLSKQKLIMLLFAVVMVLVARSMIKGKKLNTEAQQVLRKKHPMILAILGAVVGCLSGILGIGGGFIIVPLLILWLKFEVVHAISLSIVLIAGNAVLGFFGGLKHLNPDYQLLTLMTIICVIGMFIGVDVRKRVDTDKLKVGFGYFILCIGIFIVAKE